MRGLIGALEWLLRLLILNRRLPTVRVLLRDISYGDHSKQRLDVVVPVNTGPFPVVVYVHGGAWVTGDKANFWWVTHSLAHGGALVVSVNYRWAPEASFAEQLGDIADAIRWARQNASEYGGDPERMFFAGDSAGAHLVCWLHMALRQPKLLDAVNLMLPLPPEALHGSLLFYGIYDLEVTWKLGASVRMPIRSLLGAEPAAVPELTKLASPLRQIVPGVAPLFVTAGEKDLLHGQSVELLNALHREGVPSRPLLLDRKRYSDAGHSFMNFGSRKAARAALQGALAFIAEFDPG
jgi:acetyl esterase